jgi:hypothetical protein
MEPLNDLKQTAKEKSVECNIQSCAYSLTLSALAPANFVLVVGAALLSLIAGAAILTKHDLITELQAGIMALVSGGFTIIHSKLGCDQYQAECKKLVGFYKGLAEDYLNLSVENDPAEFKKGLIALNQKLSETIKSSNAFPYSLAIRWASKRPSALNIQSPALVP